MIKSSGRVDSGMQDVSANHQYKHLLVLVHGILSGPNDWRYVINELKKRLNNTFLIHASAANSYVHTLSGIDVAGRRLAEEVKEIISKNPNLERISFLGHSLGGLFARYAIAVLLDPVEKVLADESGMTVDEPQPRTIGGLLAANFVTLATPHLGVKGKKQLPLLFGVSLLEKIAAPLASLLAGQTGRQLFLMDGKPEKPPLLLQMAQDNDDLQFLSALSCFKTRICYANISYDHIVGWRTSSIRRETELPIPPRESINGYKHVVSVKFYPAVHMKVQSFSQQAAEGKEASRKAPDSKAAEEYYHEMEENMTKGLQQVSWWKVDVSFHAAFWPYLAHNNIHVKSQWLHYEGSGVVAHVADCFRKEEPVFLMSNL